MYVLQRAFDEGWLSVALISLATSASVITVASFGKSDTFWARLVWLGPLLAVGYATAFHIFIVSATYTFGLILEVAAIPALVAAVLFVRDNMGKAVVGRQKR
jgi:hypothetical protein